MQLHEIDTEKISFTTYCDENDRRSVHVVYDRPRYVPLCRSHPDSYRLSISMYFKVIRKTEHDDDLDDWDMALDGTSPNAYWQSLISKLHFFSGTTISPPRCIRFLNHKDLPLLTTADYVLLTLTPFSVYNGPEF